MQEVSDEDILSANGIAVGSPKCAGHSVSAEILAFFGKLAGLRSKLGLKAATVFSGSHGSFGGQERVHEWLFHAMMCCNMVLVGHFQKDEGFSDFVGGVVIEKLDEKTGVWARELGARLAEVSAKLAAT